METLYIPAHHSVEDLPVIHGFMEEFSFACLVTAGPSLRATHLPSLLDRDAGRYGKILGHLARNNPQVAALDGEQEAVILFQGPHHYISPSWYETKLAVPTWNFLAVHASGRPRVVEDAEVFRQFLQRLTAVNEAYEGTGWSVDQLPENYAAHMQAGAVLFEMPIERLEAKFKVGAERPAADRHGILRGLQGVKPERTLLAMTRERYQSLGLEDGE